MGNVKSIKDMAAKTRKKRSTHALFWELLKQTKGYQEQYKDVIKEGLVYNYSSGKTSSLSEMYSKYPGEYSLMIENMKGSGKQKAQRYDQSLDKERKRIIAAICAYVDKCKYVFPSPAAKVEYAKAIAARAANCAYFNGIPLSRLRAVYAEWRNKNAVDITGNPELDYIITEN